MHTACDRAECVSSSRIEQQLSATSESTMSSVTFRKSLAQRRQQQADAAAQGAAGSESGSKAQRTATGAAQAAVA